MRHSRPRPRQRGPGTLHRDPERGDAPAHRDRARTECRADDRSPARVAGRAGLPGALGDRRHRQRFPRRHRGDRAELVRPARESPTGGVRDGRREPGAQRRSSRGAGRLRARLRRRRRGHAGVGQRHGIWSRVLRHRRWPARLRVVQRTRRPSRARAAGAHGAPDRAERPPLCRRRATSPFAARVHEAIDGFDESFRIGSDEIDFCLRAQYAGFTIGLAPDAVIHYRLRSSMRDVYRQNYAYATGFAHLHRKHIDLGMLRAPRPAAPGEGRRGALPERRRGVAGRRPGAACPVRAGRRVVRRLVRRLPQVRSGRVAAGHRRSRGPTHDLRRSGFPAQWSARHTEIRGVCGPRGPAGAVASPPEARCSARQPSGRNPFRKGNDEDETQPGPRSGDLRRGVRDLRSAVRAGIVQLRWSTAPGGVFGAPGTSLVLATQPVDSSLIGRSCQITIDVHNNDSVREGTDIVIASSGASLTAAKVEAQARRCAAGGVGQHGVGFHGHGLGRLRSGRPASVAATIMVDCPDVPTTTTTTSTTTTTTTQPPQVGPAQATVPVAGVVVVSPTFTG